MEAQREQGLEPPAIGLRSGWSEVLAEIHARTAHRFVRAEVRERVGRYLVGLLDRVERKNSWQLAEALGETGPQGIQRLLNGAVWDAEGVRDDLRRFVVEQLADPTSGVLIVDETGFLKKGKHSCGVARQYTGTAGGTENAQLGVFLAYASEKGVAFIDRALLSATDLDARSTPPSRSGHSQADALRHQDRAGQADAGAGLRCAGARLLDRRRLGLWALGGVPRVVREAGARLRADAPEDDRRRVPGASRACGATGRAHPRGGLGGNLPCFSCRRRPRCPSRSRGTQPHQWVCLALSTPCPAGKRRWLLIRRSPEDPSDLAFSLAYGPAATTVPELVRVAKVRWAIEEGFAQAKGEVGLDHYEVRTWQAWRRFITLSLLAHAALVVLRTRAVAAEADAAAAQQADRQKRGCHPPHPRSSRSRCPKSAGACWRCAKRRSGGPSAWAGRSGDAPTKRWPPAVTPPSGHGACAGKSAPVPGALVRPPSHRSWWGGRLRTPNGSASCRCSRRSVRRRGVHAMTTAPCCMASCRCCAAARRGARCRRSTASGRLRTSAIGSGVRTGAGRTSWRPWTFQRRPAPHLREWRSVTVGIVLGGW
jgi:DDE superfamily endonuclease